MTSLLAEINWDGIFSGGNFLFICIFGTGAIIGTSAVLGGLWHSVDKTRQEISLKRDLVARGYNAEDIERILKATSKVGKD